MQQKATLGGLNDEILKLKSSMHEVEITTDKCGSLVAELQEAQEFVKSNVLTMDKRLETFGREKELQDRLVRDIQDSIHDKASVVELNLFEAKFANYTPREDHQALLEQLGEYTRVETAEKLAEFVKSLSLRFETTCGRPKWRCCSRR